MIDNEDGKPASAPDAAKPQGWSARLAQTKVTPAVMLLFFVALAIMSGASALVGFWTHSLSHPPPGAPAKVLRP